MCLAAFATFSCTATYDVATGAAGGELDKSDVDNGTEKEDSKQTNEEQNLSLHDENPSSSDDTSGSIEVSAEEKEDLKEASGKEAAEEGSEEISKLMESVEDLLNQLSEDQMSRLQGLLKLHYDGDHQGRDSMLESLVKGDEIIENLVNLIKLLEEKGAKINLLDEDEDEADDAEKNGDDDSLNEKEAAGNHSVEDNYDDAMEEASKKDEVDGTADEDTDTLKEEKRTEEEYADRMKASERRADDDGTERKNAEPTDNES